MHTKVPKQSNKKTADQQAAKAISGVPERASSGKSNKSLPIIDSKIFVNRAYFSIDDGGNIIIKVTDPKGELVRQIPPEDFIKAAEALKESFGNILDLEA